jgi:hypothetical protein
VPHESRDRCANEFRAPVDATHTEAKGLLKPFPIKVQTLWRQAFPGLVLGAALARVIDWTQGLPFSLPNTLPLMAVAALIVAMGYFLQPTLVGAEGLKAMTTWGFRRHVRWTDIQAVSFARLFLMQPSLRLTDSAGRAYWIARDTKDLQDLHALALQHGGKSHPLTVALETPLFRLQ